MTTPMLDLATRKYAEQPCIDTLLFLLECWISQLREMREIAPSVHPLVH